MSTMVRRREDVTVKELKLIMAHAKKKQKGVVSISIDATEKACGKFDVVVEYVFVK